MNFNSASMLLFPMATGTTPAVLDTFANHDIVIIKPEHGVLADVTNLLGPVDYTYFKNLCAEVRARNPQARILFYAYGLAARESQCPDFDILDGSDMLHYYDGRPVEIVLPNGDANFYPQRTKVINLGNPSTRLKLRNFWKTWLKVNGFDGILFDAFNPDHYAAWLTMLGCSSGAIEGAVHTTGYWTSVLTALCSELRSDLAHSGMEVWANSIIPLTYDPMNNASHASLGIDFTNSANYMTGVLNEMAHRSFLSFPALIRVLQNMKLVTDKNKKYLGVYQPKVMQYTDPGSYYPSEDEIARFYYASFLLGHVPGYTYFSYHDGEPYIGTKLPFKPYCYSWNRDHLADIGLPIGTYQVDYSGSQPVVWRDFEKAIVAVNPKYIANAVAVSSDYGRLGLLPGRYRNWDRNTGSLVSLNAYGEGMNVYPGHGVVLFKNAS
jgi:hypothetical protein